MPLLRKDIYCLDGMCHADCKLSCEAVRDDQQSRRPPHELDLLCPRRTDAVRRTDTFYSLRRSSRNVDQPDHILANPIIRDKAERRPRSGEVWLAVTKHDGVQVDPILIDQAKLGEAVR